MDPEIKDQLTSIDGKLNTLLTTQARFGTEILWIKSVGAAIISAVTYLYFKILGGP